MPEYNRYPMMFTLTKYLLVLEERFGKDRKNWAVVCPNCGEIATRQDFMNLGDRDAENWGKRCIGREINDGGFLDFEGNARKEMRGCDWVAHGIFSGPAFVELPNGEMISTFEPAPASKETTNEC